MFLFVYFCVIRGRFFDFDLVEINNSDILVVFNLKIATMSDEIIHYHESYEIIGACMEVHRELGCGFLEKVYHDALEIEFKLRGIPYVREKLIPIYYKGVPLEPHYKPDFLCYSSIVVEVKAVELMNTRDTAQAINYLKCTRFKLCLLVNFGNTVFKQLRVVY